MHATSEYNTIRTVVGKLFGLSGHIHKLKTVHGPDKSKSFIFLNYLLWKKILFKISK